MDKRFKYKCKDNDVIIRVFLLDGKADELWIKIPGEKAWTVVGVNDIMQSIILAELKGEN